MSDYTKAQATRLAELVKEGYDKSELNAPIRTTFSVNKAQASVIINAWWGDNAPVVFGVTRNGITIGKPRNADKHGIVTHQSFNGTILLKNGRKHVAVIYRSTPDTDVAEVAGSVAELVKAGSKANVTAMVQAEIDACEREQSAWDKANPKAIK